MRTFGAVLLAIGLLHLAGGALLPGSRLEATYRQADGSEMRIVKEGREADREHRKMSQWGQPVVSYSYTAAPTFLVDGAIFAAVGGVILLLTRPGRSPVAEAPPPAQA